MTSPLIPSPYVLQPDCMHAYVSNLPPDLIAVMGYRTGTLDIRWTPEDEARFPLAGKLMLDQSMDLSLFAALEADGADVETGAATMDTFIPAAKARAARGHHSTLYRSWGPSGMLLADARVRVHEARVSGVVYFVAEYSWSMQQAIAFLDQNPDVIGVQFASPGSNPRTLLPGSTLTLEQANADLSVKRAGWFGSAALTATAWTE